MTGGLLGKPVIFTKARRNDKTMDKLLMLKNQSFVATI